MTNAKENEILTKEETLKYLKISRHTLEKLMKQKQISYVKLDRRVLFKKGDIDKFLDRKKVPAKPEMPKKKKTS